jgi:hypothetical protein
MLTTSFSVSQNYGDITKITLNDTSTGSNSSPVIQNRIVYLRKANGDYLVPTGNVGDYVVWPYSDASIGIDVLDKDYALDITVKWLSGSSIEFTEQGVCLLKGYTELFLYNLTQYQTSNKRLTSNNNFYANKMEVRTLLEDAIQAVSLASDQSAAQLCLDEAKLFTDSQSAFF